MPPLGGSAADNYMTRVLPRCRNEQASMLPSGPMVKGECEGSHMHSGTRGPPHCPSTIGHQSALTTALWRSDKRFNTAGHIREGQKDSNFWRYAHDATITLLPPPQSTTRRVTHPPTHTYLPPPFPPCHSDRQVGSGGTLLNPLPLKHSTPDPPDSFCAQPPDSVCHCVHIALFLPVSLVGVSNQQRSPAANRQLFICK